MSMDDVTLLEEKEVQLRQSMQLAEEANQAKSAFLSTMSHEIRTPMTAILGFTEVLRRGNVQTDEERKRHLGTIANSGQHLLELINDVLDLSKVESGAMEFEQLGTQPLQPVLEVIDVLGVKAREKGIDLKLDHPDQVPASVTTDPARLRQIIVNLVGNAIKFTDQGEVVVEFGFDIENEQMHFVVRDTGIGMDEQQQEAAFDAFTQADVSITRRFGGTGLGLSISRQLSRALGGDISVDSVIGQGSVFTVTLPTGSLRNVPLLNRAELFQQMELDNLSTAQEWSFPDAKILVVDDGAENRELLTLVLSELGVEITTAENGQQAVEQVQAGDFDVVLMDIQMPVMDGYQAVSIIREQGHDLPVVALTANAMRGFEERVLAAGFSHYQTKPIDIDRLCNLLASLLDVDAATAIEGTQTELPIADPWKGSQMQAPIVSRLSCENERFVPIVDQFIEKFEARFKALQPALKTQDWAVIEETANWLKGAGPTVGFDCLKRPAARLGSAAIERSSRAVEAQYQGLLDLKVRLVSEGSITNVHDELSEPVESADNPVVSTLLKVHPKFASVVDRFIVRLMEELDSLELSLRSGNMDAVARFAHWLKGSGGNVGFDGFVSMATSLEQAARQQDRTAVLEISAEVQAYAARVRAGWHDPDSDSRAA